MRPHKCCYCRYAAKTRGVLKEHLQRHMRSMQFGCLAVRCRQRSLQMSNLRQHKAVHSGAVGRECQACDKVFLTSSALRHHCSSTKRTPCTATPAPSWGAFRCSFCRASFKSSADCQQHFTQAHGWTGITTHPFCCTALARLHAYGGPQDCGTAGVPFMEGKKSITHRPTVLGVLERPRPKSLFRELFGCSEVLSFPYKWLRAVPFGAFTAARI